MEKKEVSDAIPPVRVSRRMSRQIVSTEISNIVKESNADDKSKTKESKKVVPAAPNTKYPEKEVFRNPYVYKGGLLQRIQAFSAKVVEMRVFQGGQLIATLLALFASDFSVAFLPASSFLAIEILLFVILIYFIFELAIKSQGEDRYFLSFYFYMDILGAISILADVIPGMSVWATSDIDDVSNSSFVDGIAEEDRLEILRAGKLVRTGARTTKVLRLLRLLRFARFLRMLRLVNIFRLFFNQRTLQKADSEEEVPSKLGLRLADILGRRNVIMLLTIVFALPQLEVQTIDESIQEGMELLEVYHTLDTDSPFPQDYIYLVEDEAQKSTLGSDFHALKTIYMSQNVNIAELTIHNYILETSPILADPVYERFLILWPSSINSTSFAIESTYDRARTESAYNILLNIILIFMLGVSGYLFTNDVNTTIVVPIVKTTKAIKKLARTLFILTTDDDEEGEKDEQSDADESLEASFVQTIVDQLTAFFDVEPGSGKRRASTKPEVEIPKHSSVVATEDIALSPRALISSNRVKCLNSLAACWEDRQALQYFKVYLTSEFAVESLLFLQKVDSLDEIRKQSQRTIQEILNNFVKTSATAQVNISDEQRSYLLSLDVHKIVYENFLASRKELFKQLERDNFVRFKKSRLAADLINLKKKDLKEYQMLKAMNEPSEKEKGEKVSLKKMMTIRFRGGGNSKS